jgi:hypothetical protein
MNKEEAYKKGQELLNMLNGSGWEIQTWENMGWCYRAINGPLSVYPSFSNNKYYCLLGSDVKNKFGGGAAFWTSGNIFDDPNEAVKEMIKGCKEFIDGVNEVYEYIKPLGGFIEREKFEVK